MNGQRLALVALSAALVGAVAGGTGSSTGQTQDAPGLTYGGPKDTYPAWLRLAPGRRAIAAMQMDWAVAPERCSNGKTYSSALYAGFEQFHQINVSAEGRFKNTVVDHYNNPAGRHEERQTVEGTISGGLATGSISGRVKVEKPNGKVVRCHFGPQRWRLED